MPANKMTLKAVDAILQTDLGVSNIVRNNVLKALGREDDNTCSELDAARLLDISNTTLYHWRKGDWKAAPHDFWFHTWHNPTGEVRYDKEQLMMYSALRRTVSNRNNPQPIITEEDVKRFTKAVGEH